MQNLSINHTIAIEATIEASKEIMRIYSKPFDKALKKDGSPVTEADLASSRIISSFLSKSNIPIICEEIDVESYEKRKTWNSFWLVDPLDGTKEFINGNGEFAINIALLEKNEPIFGIVCSPVQELILLGGKEIGVFIFNFNDAHNSDAWQEINNKPINNPITIATSRRHSSSKDILFFHELQVKFGKTQFIEKGSALKFIDLALGKADLYPRFAPTMEWDTASGHAIISALGGVIIHPETRKSLTYNKEDLHNPHFIAKTKAFLLADV